jgi:ATP-dependent DNA helicase DinG
MLRERLFEHVPSCVLTSATLTVAESFEFFRQRIGMDAGRELSLSTEFNVSSQTMLCVPEGNAGLPPSHVLESSGPGNSRHLERVAWTSVCIVHQLPAMMAAMNWWRRTSPIRAWCRRAMQEEPLLDEFKVTPNAVLFAVSSGKASTRRAKR